MGGIFLGLCCLFDRMGFLLNFLCFLKASENQRTGQKRKQSVEEMVSKVRDRILPTLPVEPLRNTGNRYTVCGLSGVNQSKL